MATVTSITAERAQAIEDASIVDAELRGTNLILKSRGGSEINVGAVAADILDSWPVNSIYIGATATSPATLLGGGTWVRFGQGRVLVSQNDGDAEFDTALETGGSKTIPNAALPAHTHTQSNHVHTGTTHGVDHHQHSFTEPNATPATVVVSGGGGAVSDDVFHGNATGLAGAHAHTFSTDLTGGGNETGNGPSINAVHMPPYIVVYMWRRTG